MEELIDTTAAMIHWVFQEAKKFNLQLDLDGIELLSKRTTRLAQDLKSSDVSRYLTNIDVSRRVNRTKKRHDFRNSINTNVIWIGL